MEAVLVFRGVLFVSDFFSRWAMLQQGVPRRCPGESKTSVKNPGRMVFTVSLTSLCFPSPFLFSFFFVSFLLKCMLIW